MELGGVSVYLSEIATPATRVSMSVGNREPAGGRHVRSIGWRCLSSAFHLKYGAVGWRVLYSGCVIIPSSSGSGDLSKRRMSLSPEHRPSTSEILRSLMANWRIVVSNHDGR